MNTLRFEHPTQMVGTVVAVCALFAAPLAHQSPADFEIPFITSAAAAEDGGSGHKSGGSSGGHSSGGHTSGASSGGHSSGGHSSGGSSGGHSGGGSGGHSAGGHDSGGSHATGAGGHGGEKARHGLRPEHAGHASGMHKSQEHKGGAGKAAAHDRFGGGTGLAGTDQVPEGIAVAATTPGHAGEQHSFGPGPQARYRFRYWGGRGIDDGGDDDDGGGGGDDGGGDDPPSGGGGGGGSTAFLLPGSDRCDDHAPGRITGWQRFAGQNMARIDRIVLAIAPTVSGNDYMTVAHLVANFQEEMEKQKPDALLAGTYLGLASRGSEVTPQSVTNLTFGLCVPVDTRQANEIAQAAAAQKLALER